MSEKSHPFRSHPFWDFSIKIYGESTIEKACLDLQERYQLNINLLLYSAWIAHSKKSELSLAVFEKLNKHIKEWHSKVESIRSVRRSLKRFQFDDIKVDENALQKVKNIELASEYIEQTMLASIRLPPLKTFNTFEEALHHNFRNYLTFKKIDDLDATKELEVLMVGNLN